MLERLKLILRFILLSTRAQVLILGEDEKEYIINGIKYFVSPRYLTDKKGDTFENKIEKYLGGDFTHLLPATNNDRINNEYICLTAGKEVKCS